MSTFLLASTRKPGRKSSKAAAEVSTEPRRRRRSKGTPSAAGAATTGRKRRRRGRGSASSDDNDDDGRSQSEEDDVGVGLDDRYNALYADEADEPVPSRPKKRGRQSVGAPTSGRRRGRPKKSFSADSEDGDAAPLQFMNGTGRRAVEADDVDMDITDDDEEDPYATGGQSTML